MYADALRAYSPQNEQEDADRRMILEYIRRFPDNILTRDNAIAHMTSSGFVVNADASKVLMAHHNLYRRRGRRPARSMSGPCPHRSPRWISCPSGAT